MTTLEPPADPAIDDVSAEELEELVLETAPAGPAPATRADKPRKRPKKARRRPVRWFFIVSHRWLSLVLGLVLLVEAVSGALLLYKPELHHALNGEAFAASGGKPTISIADAADIVKTEHPDYAPVAVVEANDVYAVTDYETAWNVDPHTGKVLGFVDEPPSWLLFLENLHECAFSCEGEPAYMGWTLNEVPHSSWLGYDGANATWASLTLGLLGVLLLYLTLTGLWLWFPRPSRFRTGFTVRWKKGRFARDTDLHKVIGFVALVPLLMWSVTGFGFEFSKAEDAWDTITPGAFVDDEPVVVLPGTDEPAKEPIGMDAAIARAKQAAPGTHVVTVSVPAEGDTETPYDLWMQASTDAYAHTDYPGDVGISVDQLTGETSIYYGQPYQPAAQTLWDEWSYPVHSGYVVNGWWRLIWLAFGLAPLLLGITGISTWLVRRGNKKKRKKAAKARAAAATEERQPEPVS